MIEIPVEDQQRWLYSKAVVQDLKQLSRLVAKHLPEDVIAERMGMKVKDLKRVLKLLGVDK